MHLDPMATRFQALEAACSALREGATAHEAVRDVAVAFGAVHPNEGTFRAIRAVLDQREHPTDFPQNKDAYSKHHASKNAFQKWKRLLSGAAGMSASAWHERARNGMSRSACRHHVYWL